MTMSSDNDKQFANAAEMDDFAGEDRRDHDAEQDEQIESRVRFDAKGNPVWEVRTDVPRRRKDDNTVDLLKCLDDDSLALADDGGLSLDDDES